VTPSIRRFVQPKNSTIGDGRSSGFQSYVATSRHASSGGGALRLLGTQEGAPLPVDRARAGEYDILRLAREDQVLAVGIAELGRSAFVPVVREFRAAEQRRACLQVKRNVVLQHYAAREIRAR